MNTIGLIMAPAAALPLAGCQPSDTGPKGDTLTLANDSLFLAARTLFKPLSLHDGAHFIASPPR